MPRWERADAALLLTAVAVAVGLGAFGRLEPVITTDTPGYLVSGSAAELIGAPRTPLYGWWLQVVTLGTLDYTWIPIVQLALFFGAVGYLRRSLRRAHVRTGATLAVTLPLLAGNVVLLWTPTVHPELPAAAGMVVALGALLRTVATGPRAGTLVLLAISLGAAYVMRPIFLAGIFALPIAYLALAACDRVARPGRGFAAVGLAAALPFLAVATLRLAVVNDFNVVSFGGFNMSGLATQMLTPEIAERLPAEVRPLANKILARREAEIARDRVRDIPRNSRGVRSYSSVALQYFDCFARNANPLIYEVNLTMREPGESQVAFNRRMQRFAFVVIRAAPERYAAWIVGATVRSVGRMTVTNATFMIALLAWLVLWPLTVVRRRGVAGPSAPAASRDALFVLVVVAAYTASAGVIMVLTTAPESRYMDTAGLFLAALPALGLTRLRQVSPHDG